jgi:hypothetical protein
VASFPFTQIANWGPSNASFFIMTGSFMQPQKYVFITKQVPLYSCFSPISHFYRFYHFSHFSRFYWVLLHLSIYKCILSLLLLFAFIEFLLYYRFHNATTPPHFRNHALPCAIVPLLMARINMIVNSIFYFCTRITGQIKSLKCMVITVRWFRKNWGCRSVMKSVMRFSIFSLFRFFSLFCRF